MRKERVGNTVFGFFRKNAGRKRPAMWLTVLAVSVCVSVLSVSGAAGTVNAAEALTQGKVLVEDSADLLTPEEETEVLRELEQLADQSGWACFALTTADTGGKTAREYADNYVDVNAFEEDGVCFLIDMDNRELYVCTTGEAIRYLTDDRINKILDRGYPEVSAQKYTDSFISMIRTTDDMYRQGAFTDQYNRKEREKGLTRGDILAAFVVAFAAAGIVIFAVVRRYRIRIHTYRYDFRGNSAMKLEEREDRFVNQFVTRRKIESQNTGHGSTTHRSAGGGRHGGGGRRF